MNADLEAAFDIYGAIASGGNAESLVFAVVEGNPWSKSRPRFAGRKAYQGRDDALAEQKMGYALKQAANGRVFTGNVAVGCIFYRSNRQRIDTDNLLKHVCDSATGVLWKDDCQVTAIFGRVEYDGGRPRSVIVVGRDASTMQRGSDAVATCQNCQREFNIAGQPLRPYCTQRCARTALSGVDLSAEIPCEGCGTSFRRFTSSQRYCTRECSVTAKRGQPRPKMQKDRSCAECGRQRARTNSILCRACWLAKPKKAA